MMEVFRLRNSLLWGLAAGLLVLFAAGCTAAVASDEGGSVPVYTVADTTGDWGFPSPYAHYSRGPGYTRMSYLFDTLIWKDDEGHVPALAESWDLEGDDVYIFHLRDGVTWHDGEVFTAEASSSPSSTSKSTPTSGSTLASSRALRPSTTSP
jgi:peptide/nickel transport system substrate-binding protein